MIPDTVQGAVILSVIDFFASILMITGIGAVLALLPAINRLGKVDEEKLRQNGH